VKQTAKRALQAVGYYRRRLQTDPYPGVAVLAYHGVRDDNSPRGSMRFEELHVTVSRLDSHCSVLRRLGCAPLTVADWRAIAAGRRPVPSKGVLLTFDDGYRSVLTHALPILEKHGIPAAVFVCTGPVERRVRFWFDGLAERASEAAVEEAKTLEYTQWRDVATKHEMPATAGDPHAPLSVVELQTLASHPLITIGAHTATHPILAHASADEQRGEIDRSRRSLESWLGTAVSTFAYPNGRPGIDFTPITVDVVKAAGFEHAFAIGASFARPEALPYAHPRFLMLDSVSGAELAHRLALTWPRVEQVAS